MASGKAAIRHLYARTATIVDTCDQSFGPNADWKIFSGTFIQIKNRLFVATVSHSVDNFENPSRYVLIPKSGRFHPNGAAIVLKTIATDHDSPDVGLIELDSEMFREFEGSETIDISRISVARPERLLASLMGIPSKTVEIHPIENNRWGISGTMSGFTTAAINLDEWPNLNLPDKPLDSNIDILVRYPDESPDIRDDIGMQSELPEPYGISGGGLWIHNDCQNDLWTPDYCQLVGIQSSWLRDAEYVRITRISYWLDMVYSNFPDLRDVIEQIHGYSFGDSEMTR